MTMAIRKINGGNTIVVEIDRKEVARKTLGQWSALVAHGTVTLENGD